MNKKILNLILSILLVLSLVACGNKNAKNDSASTIPNGSTVSTAGTNQNTSADNSATQSDIEMKQSDSDGSNTNNVQENSNEQNSNEQNSDEQNSSKQVPQEQNNSNEQVSLEQNNNTQADSDVTNSSTTIGDNIVLDIKQEEATNAPIVENSSITSVTVDNSENTFQFINATGKFKSYDTYVQYFKDSGATYVSTTDEAIAILINACKSAQYGVNLCFSGNVNIESLIDVLPKDTTLSGYIDVNTHACQYIYNDYYFGVKFTFWTSPSEESAVTSLVSKTLSSLNQGTTYNKIKNVHDYICNNVNYCEDTLNGNSDNFSAYDALIGHKAVCQGYALAFQKFMDAMGIRCYIAKGDIDVDGSKVPHAWNIVELSGKLYSVDCTWDGQDNNTRYNYFLLGKSEYPYGITGGLSLATSRYSE